MRKVKKIISSVYYVVDSNRRAIAACLTVLIVLFYFGNSTYLDLQFPASGEDQNVWDKMDWARHKIYEVLFFICYLTIYLTSKGWAKAIAAFLTLTGFFSAFDKVILGNHQFMYYDHFVILAGIIVAIITIKRERNNKE